MEVSFGSVPSSGLFGWLCVPISAADGHYSVQKRDLKSLRNHSTSNPLSECCKQPSRPHFSPEIVMFQGKHSFFVTGNVSMLSILAGMDLAPQPPSHHSLLLWLPGGFQLNHKLCFPLRAASKVSQGQQKLIQHKSRLCSAQSDRICCLGIHGELLSLPMGRSDPAPS